MTRAARALLVLALLSAGTGARAGSSVYRGQMELQTSADPNCSLSGDQSSFTITVYGRDDAPGSPIDGYLYGEKTLHGHFSGDRIDHLSLSYPGESSASHPLHLRSVGAGSYEGTLEGNALVLALNGCKVVDARIRFNKVDNLPPATFQLVANVFELDTRAVQAFATALQGNVKEALPALQDITALKERIVTAGAPQLLPNYFLLARLHEGEGSYADAIPLFRKSLAICEQIDGTDSYCAGLMLINLSTPLSMTGNYAEAETAVRRALDICAKLYGPDAALSGNGLTALGLVFAMTGRYGEAEAILSHGLDVNRKFFGPGSANTASSMFALGVLYRLTGRYSKAEATLRQSLAINEKLLPAGSLLVINNEVMLAQTLRITGQYKEAEALARRALASAQQSLGPELGDHPVLNASLLALAEVLRETDRTAEAEPLYRKALADTEKHLGPDNPDVAACAGLLARLLRTTGRQSEALDLLKDAYRVAQTSGNQGINWRVSAELMQLYASGAAPRTTAAIFYGKQAVNTLQRLRGNLSGNDPEGQQAFVKSAEVSSVYRTLADLLIGSGRLIEAQQVLAMLKEKEYFEFIQRSADTTAMSTTATLTGAENGWTDRYAQISGQLVKLGQELATLKRKGDARSAAETQQLDADQADLVIANRKFNAAIEEIAASEANTAERTRRSDQLQAAGANFRHAIQDLGHEVVLAQYIVLDNKVDILLTTPTITVTREVTVTRKELNAKIFAFRDLLSSPKADPVPQAKALYQLLIGPIAADLRQSEAKTLALSLDDSLRYLPFAALHDDQHYLVEDYAVVMLTEAAMGSLKDNPQPDWTVWGLGLTLAKPGFAALPNVGSELNGIVGPKGITGKVQLDAQFTERSLRDGLDQQFPVIHIASHYQFTPGSSDDSFLLLGDGSRLSLSDFKTKLDLQYVDLLTLSACQTALGGGEDASGLEVEGLGAVAQNLGAKAVLATLWPVADKSTALLMQNFYRLHRDQHLSKVEALRQAQLLLLHGAAAADGSATAERSSRSLTAGVAAASSFTADPSAPFAHPYFWAPFTLMGNWR
jgi:CHAT domain-containing protein